MLFKESQMDMIFKKQKPIQNLNDFVTGVPQGGKNDRKFRVRALLKGNYSKMQKKNNPCMTSSTRRKKSISPK